MSFYQYYKFKATGTPLASVLDFSTAANGTEFEKNSGEVYVKDATSTFKKVDRIIPSRSESDLRYGQLDFINTWSLENIFDGALTSTGINIFSGDNTFNTGTLTLDSAITSGGSNIWNGINTFNAACTMDGVITSGANNIWNGTNTFNGIITLDAGAPISSAANNIWNGTSTFNDNCSFIANTFAGHQTPLTTAVYDLGSATKKWNDIHSSGAITSNTLSTVGLYVTADGSNNAYSYFWDFSSSAWRTFGWNNSSDEWVVEDAASVQRTLIHDGNLATFVSAGVEISILTGTISDGGTIPLPGGYIQAQCKWTISHGNQYVKDIGYGSQGYMTVNASRIVQAATQTINQTYYAGTCNYLIIGVK